MKWSLPLLLLAGCSDPEPLHCAVGMECKMLDNDCEPGLLVAVADGGCECVGESVPLAETCDGKDNDCDGEADNMPRRPAFTPENTCYQTQLGVCKFAAQKCILGEWRCVPPDGFGAEECDGFDNDCDGAVDEGLATEYFYGGESTTMGVGECRPGFSNCRNGSWETTEDVVPRSERCGDGLDNDCDGLVDEPGSVSENAFALVIDVSGSMAPKIAAVTEGVCDWAFAAPPTDVVAAVLFSRGDWPMGTEVYFDFVDPAAACYALTSLPADGYTTEFALEGLRSVTELTWPEDYYRTAIVFTDEPLQVILGDEDWLSLEDVPALCTEYDLRVYSMTDPLEPWPEVASSCWGDARQLPTEAEDVTSVLVSWFSGSCP